MNANEEHTTAGYWEQRLAQMSQEHALLFEFVYGGMENGRVTKEASRAFFKASVDAMHRAGIIGPALGKDPALQEGGVDRAMACTVLEQALHSARLALLRVQPELRDALEREAPPSRRGGRSP
jgi:hypothetical protein